MKSKFRTGIIIFGLALPLLILGVFSALLLSQKGKLEKTFAEKKAQNSKNKKAIAMRNHLRNGY